MEASGRKEGGGQSLAVELKGVALEEYFSYLPDVPSDMRLEQGWADLQVELSFSPARQGGPLDVSLSGQVELRNLDLRRGKAPAAGLQQGHIEFQARPLRKEAVLTQVNVTHTCAVD